VGNCTANSKSLEDLKCFATGFIEIQPLLPKYTILNTVFYKSAQNLNTLSAEKSSPSPV
jgi:hypothetical protein